jgi:glycosyltransferase involved in cell wall biosynthesis
VKKIGYILRKFPVLSETFVIQEILELEALGHEVVIFSLAKPNTLCPHPMLGRLKGEIIYLPEILPFPPMKGLLKLIKYRKWELYERLKQATFIAKQAKKQGILHLHAHFASRAATVAYFCSYLSKIPYSFTAHAVDIFRKDRCQKALKDKIEQGSFVATISQYNLDFLRQISPNGKILKILNGIDLNKFSPQNIKTHCFTFICIARLVEKKGHRYLIEACDLLKKQGLTFQCLLVGSGKLKEDIEKMIIDFNLDSHIKLLGALDHSQVLSLLQKSDAFVLPCILAEDGNRDGLPVSIVEALACSLPVITTAMTANPEVVKDGINGILVPFADSQALAKGMEKLLVDKNYYQMLSKQARASIAIDFDKTKTAKMLSYAINEVV